MIRLLLVFLVVLMPLGALPASAMQFAIVKSGGQTAVLAQGIVKDGDARRLTRALARVPRDRNGTKQLLLDSPGGTVVDAWDMAEIISRTGVTTVIPAGGVCASACASLMFVAGKYRTIQPGGQLAIHSCYDARNGAKIDYCDAIISARAQQQGLSGIALMALQEIAPGPNAIVVLDGRNAACYGLTRAPGKAELGDRAPCVAAALKKARAGRN